MASVSAATGGKVNTLNEVICFFFRPTDITFLDQMNGSSLNVIFLFHAFSYGADGAVRRTAPSAP